MADITKIKKQVIDLLNANAFDDDTGEKLYSTASGDEDYLSEAIDRAIEEAKTIVAEKVCLAENSTLKQAFTKNLGLAHGELLPTHYGQLFNVKIVPFEDAETPVEAQKRSSSLINAYRRNPDNIYGETPHDQPDEAFDGETKSQLAGFYSDASNVFEFTGFSASISFCDFTNVALTAYPVSLEVPITHVAVGVMAKDGSVSNKFSEHLNIGLSLLGDTIKEEKQANK